MPAKKDKDEVVEEPKNPATAAHEGGMDPDLEAKRSGPPAATTEPKPLADPDAGFEKPSEQFDRSGEAPSPESYAEIEAKLKDPTFDPDGHERLRLAEESRKHGVEPYPPTSDVDEHGNPVMTGEDRDS